MPKTFLIAECGSCHDMDFNKAKGLVQMAKECGADAAKFQWWSSAKRMATRRHAQEYEAIYQKYAMPEGWLEPLKTVCDAWGIEFMCSTYLPEDVDTVAPLVNTMKIASFEANDPVHLAAHVKHLQAGKRLIISCGIGANQDVIMEYLTRRVGWSNGSVGRVVLLWCVSAYPAPSDELNLIRLREHYLIGGTTYRGFSDHSEPRELMTGAIAVAAGAEVIERHIKLTTTSPDNPDYPHAQSPDFFANYVANIRGAEKMLGEVPTSRAPMPSEAPMRAYVVRE